jgi:iron complex transport system substrate-binding protein
MRHLLIASAVLALLAAPALARDITHAMGTTAVPDHPQRVVVLTNEGTEALLAVGVVPVGAVESYNGDPWYDYLTPMLTDVAFLGAEAAVNLEVIASLEPDLIIGTKVRQEKIYEQLSAIAPTVMSETVGVVWQDNLRLYANAVGKSAEGEAALTAFAGRIAVLHEALGDNVNEKLSFVRIAPGRTRIYHRLSFPGMIFEQLGFKRPAAQSGDVFSEDITKERIPDADGDRLFYIANDDLNSESETNLADWLNDPLWQSLNAVKNGKAQRVSETKWIAGGGIYSANMMLDDIEAIYGLPSTIAATP